MERGISLNDTTIKAEEFEKIRFLYIFMFHEKGSYTINPITKRQYLFYYNYARK